MKVLKIAATVVGTVAGIAMIATGVGAPIGTGLLGVTWGTMAAAAAVTSLVLNTVSTLTAKKPKLGSAATSGSPQQFKLDPQAPVPYIMGRTVSGGYVVHRATFGATIDDVHNPYQSFAMVWSLGPINALEAFQVDRTTISFSGGAATGAYAGHMWLDSQLGALPEADALERTGLPQWGSSYKLSGLAAGLWTLKFDKNGKKYAAGVPLPQAIIQGVKVYDPRLDSTYPGGSGSCRALNEGTYVYSENPWLHALTFALGRWQNGQRVFGVGMPKAAIDIPAFVEAANIADANGWKIGGTVTSDDEKWNALKMMCQAGGGEPIRMGAKLSCLVSAPRVSLATITSKDLIGRGSVVATQPRRTRINGVVPRVRSESHGWEVVPLDVVRIAAYVTEDGGERTREIDYQLVQIEAGGNVTQPAELAAYDVLNAREFGPISLPLKTLFMGYRPGDCLTIDIHELGLDSQDAILINRSLDPQSAVATLDFKSETPAKHPFALGKTGTPPPTPSLEVPDLSDVIAPDPIDWTLTGESISSGSGSLPALVFSGIVNNPNAEAVIFEYRLEGDTEWSHAGTEDVSATRKVVLEVAPQVNYEGAVSYRVRGVVGARLILGPVESGSLSGADGDKFQWSLNGLDDWHADYVDGDLYMRQSTDGGATWGPAIPIVNEGVGATGNKFRNVFKRSATQPATPTGNNTPSGWSDGVPPDDGNPAWVSIAEQTADNVLIGTWSAPAKISGEDGTAAPNTLIQWSPDGTSSWGAYTTGDRFMRTSTDNGVTWSAAILAIGEDGGDGTGVSIIFKRSASQPTTPTGNNPVGWSDGPPAADGNPLWMSKANKDASGVLIGPWSVPVRIEAASVIVQWSPDGSTSWGTYTAGDRYIRTSSDGGATWSTATLVVGENGTGTQSVFKRGATEPAAPTGNGIPTGWSDGPPADNGQDLWLSTATQEPDGTTIGSWSTPVRLNGTSAYTGLLTNESHTLPASSAGVVSSYSGATGSFKIFFGSTDVSSSFSLSTVSGGDPQSLTESYVGQTYSVTGGLDAGEDGATLTIRATGSGAHAGVSIDKVFTLAKSKGGATGADAKLLYVISDRQNITYSGAGAVDPSSQTTTFTAQKSNTSATVTWTMTRLDGTSISAATYLSATTGDSVTMTAANFNTARGSTNGVIVIGTLADGVTISDKISVVKVQQGSDGSPGTEGPGSWTPNVSNITRSAGNTFEKTGGANSSQDAYVYSTEKWTQAKVSFQPLTNNVNVNIGLDAAPSGTVAQRWQNHDYSIGLGGDGIMRALAGGSIVYTGASYAANDLFTIEHRGSTVVATKNGTVVHTFATALPATTPMALVAGFEALNKTIKALTFTSSGAPGTDGGTTPSPRVILDSSDILPNSGTTETTIDSDTFTLPAGGSFKISGAVVSETSTVSSAFYIRVKVAGVTKAEAIIRTSTTNTVNYDQMLAWLGKVFTNTTSGSQTVSLTRQRINGGGATVTYDVSVAVEHVP